MNESCPWKRIFLVMNESFRDERIFPWWTNLPVMNEFSRDERIFPWWTNRWRNEISDETRDSNPFGYKRNGMYIDSPNPEFSRPMRSDDETSFSSFLEYLSLEFREEGGLYSTRWRRLKRWGGGKEIKGDREIGGRKKRGGGARLPLSHPVWRKWM